MQYRYLGRSGLKVSSLSFGSWVTFGTQLDVRGARTCMELAHDAGVNFFDNAEVYAEGDSERIMGEVLRDTGWPRESYLISTKVFWGGNGPNDRGLSRKHIIEGTHAALRRLGLDYVDLLFCHRPDLHTPVEETVWAMNLLIQQGKALYWGTSEWSAARILEAVLVAERNHLIPPCVEQAQYNMFTRHRVEVEYEPLYRLLGLGTTIWSPLASGLLTGKYESGMQPGTRLTIAGLEWLRAKLENEEGVRRIAKVKRLVPIAEELGSSVAQLAIAWCLLNPNVSTVLTGASRPSQLVENLKAIDLVLAASTCEAIEAVLENKPDRETDFR